MPAFSITSDVFSPMLVKELRQGVKSKAFYFAFLLMQTLMVFCVIMYLALLQNHDPVQELNALFWICTGATLIFIIPLRAMSALQQEIKGNTLELIFLTRLGAWRIITGKWLALFSQALLLATGTLPYLLLRYFLGGINVSDDLQALFWMLVASAVLTAIGVCISSFIATWVRVLIIMGAVLFPYFGIVFFFSMRFGGSSPAIVSTHGVAFACLMVVCAVLAVLLCFAWGASRIAPPAENYARWKRLLTFALIALLPALAWAASDPDLMMAGFFILIPMCAEALCEQPRFISSVYRPFLRRGIFGRLAGLLLFPGWPFGLIFTLFSCAIFFAATGRFGPVVLSDRLNGIFIALPGALIFPLAAVLLFKPRAKSIIPGYLAIQIACIILALVGISVHASYAQFSVMPLSILPPSAFILQIANSHSDPTDPAWLPISALVSIVSLLALIFRMIPVVAKIRNLNRDARP